MFEERAILIAINIGILVACWVFDYCLNKILDLA